MSDWADEESIKLSPVTRKCVASFCAYPEQCMCTHDIAAALRKAKADGMREAAEYCLEWPRATTENMAAALLSKADKIHRASAIEKGTE